MKFKIEQEMREHMENENKKIKIRFHNKWRYMYSGCFDLDIINLRLENNEIYEIQFTIFNFTLVVWVRK